MKKDEATEPDYILIVGQGRSGTNWLLDLLDLSPKTHCRNEADELVTSPLAQLPSPTVRQSQDDSFRQQWDQAIASASLRMGERDRIGTRPKFHLYEPMRRLGGATVLSKRRLRQPLSLVMPSLRQPDWPVPWWFANPYVLRQASVVLKLNQVPAWAEWVLLNRPSALVIHIVRHPGGFLNSWQNRYLASQDSATVKSANEERLRQVAESDARWARLFPEVGAMSIEESELWYWRYATEIIHSAGQGRPNYVPVLYENLVADPLKITKHLYEKCNLPWTAAIEREVSNSASHSNSVATAWYEKLLPEQIEIVKRVLAGSLMSQCWDEASW